MKWTTERWWGDRITAVLTDWSSRVKSKPNSSPHKKYFIIAHVALKVQCKKENMEHKAYKNITYSMFKKEFKRSSQFYKDAFLMNTYHFLSEIAIRNSCFCQWAFSKKTRFAKEIHCAFPKVSRERKGNFFNLKLINT